MNNYTVEDQNFALFNYVNELNGEMELLQEQIQQIQDNIKQFESQGVEMEEKRKEILKELELELTAINDEATSYESRYSATTKILDQLKSGMNQSFLIVTETLYSSQPSGLTLSGLYTEVKLIVQHYWDMI